LVWAVVPYTQAGARSAGRSCAAAALQALPDERAFPRAAQWRPQPRAHSAALPLRAVLQPAVPQAASQQALEEQLLELPHSVRRVSELPEPQSVAAQAA